jgi:uncharacterized protein (TIGR00369 family)
MNETTTVDRAMAQAMIERALAEPRQEFGSFFLSRLLGFEVSFEDERCIVAFEATRALFNPQGTLHGGILATAMDVSMGHLLQHIDGAGATLTMTVQFLSPAKAGPVRCEASFLRHGRSVSSLKSEAFQGDILIAHAVATWKLRSAK